MHLGAGRPRFPVLRSAVRLSQPQPGSAPCSRPARQANSRGPRLLPVWARMSSGASGLDRQDPRTVEMSAAIGSRTVKERVEGGILPSGQPGQAGVGGDPADARSLPMLHAAAGGAAGDAKSWLHLSRSPNPSVWVKSDAQRALLTRMQGGGSATSVTGRDIQAVTDGSLGGVLGGTEVYTYPQLTGYAGHYDAVVVGAGIVGVSTAYHLLSRGLSVCLVEGRDCGGGTTGFSTAKVSSNHQIAYTILSSKHGKEAAKQYGQLSELGIQGLQAVVDAVPGLKEASEWERTPHITYTEQEALAKGLQEEARIAAELGLPATYRPGGSQGAGGSSGDGLPLGDLPASLMGNIKGALVFKDQASFNSFSFTRAMVAWMVREYGHRLRVYEGSLVYHVHDPDSQAGPSPTMAGAGQGGGTEYTQGGGGVAGGGSSQGVSFMEGAPKDVPSSGPAIPANRPIPGQAPDGSPAVMVGTEGGGWVTGRSCILATHMPITDRSMHWAVATPSRSFCIAVELEGESSQAQGQGQVPYASTNAPLGMYISLEEPAKSLRSALWYIPKDSTSSLDPQSAARLLTHPTRVLVVSGESAPQGDTTDADFMYRQTLEWVMKHWKVRRLVSTWSSMDFYPADSMPYIGLTHRGTARLYTATGFAKWGLAAGWASGQVLSDMVRVAHARPNTSPGSGARSIGELAVAMSSEALTGDRQTDLVEALGQEQGGVQVHASSYLLAKTFDARRWDIRKSMGGMLEEQVHVARHMIGDWAKALLGRVPAINSLKVGEGGLVKTADGETIGAYRDDEGKLHAVKPVCTHMGCHLVFLQGEKCWDCPCHGSQFDVDGRVMQGPACRALHTKELTAKDLEW